MLIIPQKRLITSHEDLPSIRKARRTIIIFDIENSLKNRNEIFLINESEEVGGQESSIFVGRSSSMKARVQFFYRGKFLSPLIYSDPVKKVVDGNALVQLDAVSYSYIMNGCTHFNGISEMATTEFLSNMTGEIPEYPSRENLQIPNPKYYTESHQHFAGEERANFLEKIMGLYNKSDYVIAVKDLVDRNTELLHCDFDASGWNDAGGSAYGGPGDFDSVYGVGALHYFMNYLSYVQHALLMNLTDSMTLIVDTEEGFNITQYNSILNPLVKGISKTDSMVNLMQTLEDAYQNMREQFIKPIRLFIHFVKGRVQVKFVHREPEVISRKLLERTRSQSDIMFYDFHTFLK